MKRTLLMLVLTLLATTAFAGPLNPKTVGADAVWIAHLDITGFLASDIGKEVLGNLTKAQKEKLDSLTELMGMDLRKDIHSVTLWGNSYDPNDGAAIFTGNLNQEKLIALAKLNDGYAVSKSGDFTVYQWKQKPQDSKDKGLRYSIFANNKNLVIGRSLKSTLQAAKVIKGVSKSLSDKSKLFAEAPKGAFLSIYGSKLGDLAKNDPNAAWAKQLKSGSIYVGQFSGKLFVESALQAIDAKTGDQFRKMLNGLLAMTQLRLEENPEEAESEFMKSVINGITIAGEGANIRTQLLIDSELLVSMIKKFEMQPTSKPSQKANGNTP